MSNTILSARPEDGKVVQAFGSLGASRIGLPEAARAKSVAALNRLVAHAMALRDLYKKAHWQTSGATFYALTGLPHGAVVERLQVEAHQLARQCGHGRPAHEPSYPRHRGIRPMHQ